jgi:hypothetical protein
VNRSGLVGVGGNLEIGVTDKGHRVFLWGAENVLKLLVTLAQL